MTVKQRIVIAGASGFIGRHLVRCFTRDGARVVTIGRGSAADARWEGDLGGVLEGADALVNLAGRSVSCRYTKRTADEILRSRTETTRALGHALAECTDPPVWLNASTGTIYRDARDRPQDEATGDLGSGFSVAVARAWERELWDAPVGVRKVALRMSIVLGDGGAMNPNINLARMGFGGRQGDGGQIISWIHADDVYRAVRHVLAHEALTGAVNLASPHPVTNEAFMREVRAQLGGGIGRRIAIPLPAWSLEAGARIIRTEAELVLKSRWVQPQKLLDSGFTFEHPSIESALARIGTQTRAGLVPVQLG